MTLIFLFDVWGDCILPVLSAALPDGRPFPRRLAREGFGHLAEALTTEEMLESEPETYGLSATTDPNRSSGRGELQAVLRPLLEGGGGSALAHEGAKIGIVTHGGVLGRSFATY